MPTFVTSTDNYNLRSIPSSENICATIFNTDPYSALMLDDFKGKFF